MKKYLIMLLVVLSIGFMAQAEILPLVNGDFEDTGTVYPNGATGWSTSGFGIGSIEIDDTQACIFNIATNSQVINQIVSYSLVTGETYTMSFDIIQDMYNWTSVNAQLWARHPTLGTLEQIGTYAVTPDDLTSPDGWNSFSFDYEYTGAANWTPFVQFQVVGGQRVYLDNIVVQTVPEPITMGLLGAGTVGIILRRRKLMK